MPLSPAEVHNVAFKKPPIGKRGYDEEEVDAFLDIVEVELARLIEENNDLRARGGQGAPAGDVAAAAPVDTAELDGLKQENQRLQGRVGELERTLSQGKDGAQQQLVELQQRLGHTEQQLAQTEQQLAENRSQLEASQAQLEQAKKAAAEGQAAPAAPAALADHHTQAVQVLALAQQTADQHLGQAKTEAETLLADARSNAESTIKSANEQSSRQLLEAEGRAKQLDEESQARASQTVAEAEQRAAAINSQLEQRRGALERRLEELRTFEREYRTRLKSYLESQLRDLDASGRSDQTGSNGALADAQQS
jgi:DivIVA domain-containing protein